MHGEEESPRIDGLLVEFYQTPWPHIFDDFCNVYLGGIEIGSFGPIINQGSIKLIPKGKDGDTIDR